MSITAQADVIVVGAGPSGSATAYHAARAGLRVTLLDRQEFPRDKACGDGLLPHAASEIRRMGLDEWLSNPQHGRFEGYAIYSKTATVRERDGEPGYIIPRKETDAALLGQARAAGADFHEGVKAESLLYNPGGEVTGVHAVANGEPLSFHAPLVVAADGIGRFAADGIKGSQNGIALRQYFSGVQVTQRDMAHFWFTEDMSRYGIGYGWVFFFGDGEANVGVGLLDNAARRSPYKLKQLHYRFLEEPSVKELLEGSSPQEEPKSWSLKMGTRGNKKHGQGLMVVGEAAGLTYPLSGEGVGFSLESGRIAAKWAEIATSRNDYSSEMLAGYAQEHGAMRGRHFLSGQYVAEFGDRYPRLDVLENLLSACQNDPGARETLSRVFYGDSPVYEMVAHPKMLGRAAYGSVRNLRVRRGERL